VDTAGVSPRIIDGWKVIDRWWTDWPVEREYVVAEWWGKALVFVSVQGDVFRVVGPWS
jgi:hypothetical protein